MATLKKVTLMPKKASKPPVVVVKKEKFNAEREIKVLSERLKAIDDYIERSDNADTSDKLTFERFISSASLHFSDLEEKIKTTEERAIMLAADWGKQKTQTDTSLRALAENQIGNEMAIEAAEEGFRHSASFSWNVALFAFIAAVGSIAMQIYAYYH